MVQTVTQRNGLLIKVTDIATLRLSEGPFPGTSPPEVLDTYLLHRSEFRNGTRSGNGSGSETQLFYVLLKFPYSILMISKFP